MYIVDVFIVTFVCNAIQIYRSQIRNMFCFELSGDVCCHCFILFNLHSCATYIHECHQILWFSVYWLVKDVFHCIFLI
jgi:hypothetical protein